MKKIYTLSLMLLLGATSMFAQKSTDVKFVKVNFVENGDVTEIVKTGDVEDGAVINVSTINDDGIDPFISTGLGVENTTDGGKRVQIEYEILKLDNGGVQCCFNTCTLNRAVGLYYTPMLSSSGNRINMPVVKKHEVNDLAGEWFFTGDGVATVKFTIKIGTKNTSKTDSEGEVYDVIAEGPSVTVNFLKGDAATGIDATTSDNTVKTEYYDLSGRKVAAPSHGVYVKKQQLSDGTVKTSKVTLK